MSKSAIRVCEKPREEPVWVDEYKTRKRFNLKIKFVWRDIWIGLYVKPEAIAEHGYMRTKTTWYLCLVPMLPIIWVTYKSEKWNAFV